MDASCGPSNALSQLSKHTQRDNSLQHERQFAGNFEQNAFRNGPGLDNNLNQDFHRFAQGDHVDFQPQNFSQNHGSFHGQNLHAQSSNGFRQGARGNSGKNSEWVSDFSGLSLQERQAVNAGKMGVQNQGQKSDWHHQFMQNMQGQNMGQGQNQNFNQQSHFGGSSMGQYQPMMGQFSSQNHQMQPQPQFQQHDALDSIAVDEQALSRQFDIIERELEQENVEKAVPQDDSEKAQFAEAARQVHQSMVSGNAQQSQETASKFQQSNFLKLMSSISDRKVEISHEGDKLVTSTGEDIREHLSDPLRHERTAEPDYHAPKHEASDSVERPQNADTYTSMYGDIYGNIPGSSSGAPTRTNESENIRNHLPDPLAHIKDGALDGDLSSLQAARIISGNQVQENSWMEDEMWDMGQPTQPVQPRGTRPSLLSKAEQEVYDDYRHDDH